MSRKVPRRRRRRARPTAQVGGVRRSALSLASRKEPTQCSWKSKLNPYYRCTLRAEPGQSLCIAHLPGPKDVGRFNEVVGTRFHIALQQPLGKREVDLRGFVFPESVSCLEPSGVDCTGFPAQLEADLMCDEAVFNKPVYLRNFRIAKTCSFSNTVFEYQLELKGAELLGDLVLDHAKVRGGLYLTDAVLGGKVDFNGGRLGGVLMGAEGRCVCIPGTVNLFRTLVEGDLDASGRVFLADVELFQAEVKGSLRLPSCRFCGRASFRELRVARSTDLRKSMFEDQADFTLARLGEVADFAEASLLGKSWFGQCKVDDLSLGPDAPAVHLFGSSAGIMLKDHAGAGQFWHMARRAFEKSGRREKADGSFYLERVERMTVLRTSSGSKPLRHLAWFLDLLLLRATCGYGASLSRVGLVWGLLFLGFAAAYALVPGLLGDRWLDLDLVQRLGPALFTSISCFTTIGYGFLNLSHSVARAIGSFQAVLGALLIALTVAVVVRKFMR